MGILNVTPDSFSDGGKFAAIEAALARAGQMLAEGADMIDVGGESTRPGSDPVPASEQIRRVAPVIQGIRQMAPKTVISIDTSLREVAEAALQAGADMINDVSAGSNDAGVLSLAAAADVPIVLMHCLGTPKTMQDDPIYADVIAEIVTTLRSRVDTAVSAGVSKHRIIIDPGIGFGKRRQDNLQILAHLDAFVGLGFPVLLGASRKRFMGSLCNVVDPSELVTATAVTSALGVMAGVDIFRVHDVKANRQAIDIAWAIKGSR